MQVILKQDVRGTGKAGDLCKVSDGYARNMLIPKGLAMEATDKNIKALEAQKAKEAAKRAQDKADAQALAEELKKASVTIKTKAGEGGRIFGSITSKDIADALKDQCGLVVDKKKIVLDGTLKQTGAVTVDIKLYTEVTGKLTVNVVAE